MKHFYLLPGILFICVFAPFVALSQSNYHKATVVVNSNQTLTGYINYHEWDENPENISFKNSLTNAKPQVFTPATIQSFSLDGFETYYSFAVRISLNRIKFPDIPIGRDTSSKTAAVFLKLVTTGDKLSLLSYTDLIKTRYYIQEKQGQPIELMYQQYYDDAKTTALSSNEYLAQLNALITKYSPGNEKLFSKTTRAGYRESDIAAIVDGINGKQAVKSHTPEAKSQGSIVRYFVGAALNITRTGFEGEVPFAQLSKANTTTPKINAGIDVFTNPNPNFQRFIFRVELSYTYVNLNVSGLYTNGNSDVTTQHYSFNQYTGTITPQIIWNFYSTKAVKIYVGAGLAFNVSKFSNENFIAYEKYQNPDVYVLDLGTTALTFPVQAGVVFNKHIELFVTAIKAPSLYDGSLPLSIYSDSYNAGIRLLFGNRAR